MVAIIPCAARGRANRWLRSALTTASPFASTDERILTLNAAYKGIQGGEEEKQKIFLFSMKYMPTVQHVVQQQPRSRTPTTGGCCQEPSIHPIPLNAAGYGTPKAALRGKR